MRDVMTGRRVRGRIVKEIWCYGYSGIYFGLVIQHFVIRRLCDMMAQW